jgi:hypothetical protein
MIADNPSSGKSHSEPYIMSFMVILVGVAAFGLGRLSALGGAQSHLIINAPITQTAAVGNIEAPTASQSASAFVASKNGTKYYPVGCAARCKNQARKQSFVCYYRRSNCGRIRTLNNLQINGNDQTTT